MVAEGGDDIWSRAFDDDFVAGGLREGSAKERKKQGRKDRRRQARPRRRGLIKPALAVVAFLAAAVVGFGISGRGPLSSWHKTDDAATGSTTASLPPATGPAGTGTTIAFISEHFATGDCATWDQASGAPAHRSIRVVSCDESHLIEFTGEVAVSVVPDHFPTSAEWNSTLQRDCSPSVTAFLGAAVDPDGRLTVAGLYPLESSWAAGDRTLQCGVEFKPTVPIDRGIQPASTTEAKGRSQELLYPIGTCLNPSSAEIVTACSTPHTAEITGAVDLTGRIDAPPTSPDLAAWESLAGPTCTQQTTGYLGHVATAPERVIWFPISATSWALGDRIVACGVVLLEGDTSAPMRKAS